MSATAIPKYSLQLSFEKPKSLGDIFTTLKNVPSDSGIPKNVIDKLEEVSRNYALQLAQSNKVFS